MSIKIHHGPPGSYKTSGAVNDDFLREALAGRVIITNVRGLDGRERIIDIINNRFDFRDYIPYLQKKLVPDSFDIIHVDTTNQAGRAKLASFFHWAPHGSFLLIDEAQMVFPLAWKVPELRVLDYPGGLVAATRDNRPPDFLTAFEMHRHYGYDLVLTTPNISKIRKDIRDTSEGAYKHKNQALIGLKGLYIEGFHLAEDSGKSAADFLSVKNRKISKLTWSLYASTATGTHSDTIAGSPIWKDPKVLGLLLFLALLFTFLLSRPAPAVLGGSGADVSGKTVAVGGSVSVNKAGSFGSGSVVAGSSVAPVLVIEKAPFSGHKWRMAGSLVPIIKPMALVRSDSVKQFFYIKNDEEEVFINTSGLAGYGYMIRVVDACHVEVTYRENPPFPVYCSKSIVDNSKLPPVNM